MTHLWTSGDPLVVAADADFAPERVSWRYHAHPVARIHQRWRVDREWWRVRIWRDYFWLSTTTGLRVVVYHDLLTDEWCLQRLYD